MENTHKPNSEDSFGDSLNVTLERVGARIYNDYRAGRISFEECEGALEILGIADNDSVTFGTPEIPTPEELLADPSTPFWAQDVIRIALDKDCVDVANVLEVLAQSFAIRARKILGS